MVKLSVIMPLYNAEEYLKPAIESVLNQTFTEYELLVVDDCSTDNTFNILNSYKDDRLKIYRNDTNLGSLISRNKLFELVKTKYIAFQDADDISDLTRFYKQVNFLEQHPEIGLCGSFCKAIDASGNIISQKEMPVSSEDISKVFFEKCPVVFSSTIIRKSVLDEVGGFREYFKDKGNYDFDWLSMISEKFKIENIPEYLYKRRILSISNSKSVVNQDKIFGDKIVLFLKKQRQKYGKDALMGCHEEEFEEFIEGQRSFIRKHPEYYFQWQMHTFMSYGMYKEALLNAFLAIKSNPMNLQGYRDAQYIIRKILAK